MQDCYQIYYDDYEESKSVTGQRYDKFKKCNGNICYRWYLQKFRHQYIFPSLRKRINLSVHFANKKAKWKCFERFSTTILALLLCFVCICWLIVKNMCTRDRRSPLAVSKKFQNADLWPFCRTSAEYFSLNKTNILWNRVLIFRIPKRTNWVFTNKFEKNSPWLPLLVTKSKKWSSYK